MYSKSLGKRQWDSTWHGLPGEIRRLIFEALLQNDRKLSRFATVSREWQAEIERYIFAQIKVTPSRLADFDSMTRRNRALVGCVWFCLELGRYDCTSCAPDIVGLTREEYYEANSTCNTDNGPITESFRDLFAILGTWEPNGELTLDISIYSPSDAQHWFPYLTFMPDTPSNTLGGGGGGIEQTMPNKNFHDPRHGWVAGYRHFAPPFAAIDKVFYPFMKAGRYGDLFEHEWWDELPAVPAVSSLLLRQQNRRRWKPESLAHMLARFPKLQEFHYEPWRQWDIMQRSTDRRYGELFESMQVLNNTLKKLVIFENFNQQYPAVMQHVSDEINSIRNPAPAVGRMLSLASVGLDHLAASFIIDASHFFEIDDRWEWPNLSSLVLTSKRLTPDEDPTEIGAMLQAAAAAALKMPRLETMEIWNGRKGLAALFKYQATRKYRQATITWRGTWRLTMEPSVIKAWETVLHQYNGWKLHSVQESLDKAVINSHADAIHYLKLSTQVIRPISLQQIRMEQKALEGVETMG